MIYICTVINNLNNKQMNKERDIYNEYRDKIKDIQLEMNTQMRLAGEHFNNRLLELTLSETKTNFEYKVDLILKGTGYDSEDIFYHNRKINILLIRHALVYILKIKDKLSYPELAILLHRDHSTLINSVKRIKECLEFPKQNEYQYRIYNLLLTNYLNFQK